MNWKFSEGDMIAKGNEMYLVDQLAQTKTGEKLYLLRCSKHQNLDLKKAYIDNIDQYTEVSVCPECGRLEVEPAHDESYICLNDSCSITQYDDDGGQKGLNQGGWV